MCTYILYNVYIYSIYNTYIYIIYIYIIYIKYYIYKMYISMTDIYMYIYIIYIIVVKTREFGENKMFDVLNVEVKQLKLLPYVVTLFRDDLQTYLKINVVIGVCETRCHNVRK